MASINPDSQAVRLLKPSIVSRTAWGCPDGEENSRAAPEYTAVTHLVIHHTVLVPDGESVEEYAALVRSIWDLHVFTRGWNDIGYNFLIDPTGLVYEGRAGGDDAVAFHDTANDGSMGVVLIGTYATVPPTPAAQSSLVSLLAWKAQQKGIKPLYAFGHGHLGLTQAAATGRLIRDMVLGQTPAIDLKPFSAQRF